jgi:hypothetical protein
MAGGAHPRSRRVLAALQAAMHFWAVVPGHRWRSAPGYSLMARWAIGVRRKSVLRTTDKLE